MNDFIGDDEGFEDLLLNVIGYMAASVQFIDALGALYWYAEALDSAPHAFMERAVTNLQTEIDQQPDCTEPA
jgi:hypothetical protein